jgi:hypothetical protein
MTGYDRKFSQRLSFWPAPEVHYCCAPGADSEIACKRVGFGASGKTPALSACPPSPPWSMLWLVATPPQNRPLPSCNAIMVRRLIGTIATLVVMGWLAGLGFDWAGPRFYGTDRTPGFRIGVLHGALMPVAFPSLLVGKDVPIYSPAQTGRLYKLGYIAGVNLCGLIFFGATFRLTKKPEGYS